MTDRDAIVLIVAVAALWHLVRAIYYRVKGKLDKATYHAVMFAACALLAGI